MLDIAIPGIVKLRIEQLVLDMNGTIALDGLIDYRLAFSS